MNNLSTMEKFSSENWIKIWSFWQRKLKILRSFESKIWGDFVLEIRKLPKLTFSFERMVQGEFYHQHKGIIRPKKKFCNSIEEILKHKFGKTLKLKSGEILNLNFRENLKLEFGKILKLKLRNFKPNIYIKFLN